MSESEMIVITRFKPHCPECAAEYDEMYGWAPLVRMVEIAGEPHFMRKEQCFGCGYHDAKWVSLDWSKEDREIAKLTMEILTKEKKDG